MSQTVRRSDSPTVHLIPHTHWDREWYLPLALFQAKLVPVLDEALELLESDATQRVTLDGQTVLLEDYFTFRPEARDRVRRRRHGQGQEERARACACARARPVYGARRARRALGL